MKRILLATAASALLATAATAQEPVNLGIILGFTGPLESITPGMAASAELAMKEASDSGKLPGGITLNPVRADSTCIDAAAATTAAQQLVSSQNVAAIVGADCSGVTTAIANNVADPGRRGDGLALGDLARPHHHRGQRLLLPHRPVRRPPGRDPRRRSSRRRASTEVAVTYTNNDYGKGLADAFASAFQAAGGTVAISAAHEDGKADYSAEVAALQASGAEHAHGLRLRRPGRRRHRPGLARHRRLRELLLRRRHVRARA